MEKLEGLGQALAGGPLDRERFRTLAEGHRSAWAMARRWFWPACLNDAARTVCALYATLLWEHWLPDRPSMERIDDLLEEGASRFDAGDSLGAVEAWLAFWDALRSAASPDSSLPALDGYLMTIKVTDWLDVFVQEAEGVVEGRPTLRAAVDVVKDDVERRRRFGGAIIQEPSAARPHG